MKCHILWHSSVSSLLAKVPFKGVSSIQRVKVTNICSPIFFQGCPNPHPPRRGFVDVPQGTAAGHAIRYSCSEGHMLRGEGSQVCRADSTWDENKPKCFAGKI